MKQAFVQYWTLLGLFAIALVVLIPVMCEIDSCCEDDYCSPECLSICATVAVCSECFDDLEALDIVSRDLPSNCSQLPQGILPLPDRPPIAAC